MLSFEVGIFDWARDKTNLCKTTDHVTEGRWCYEEREFAASLE
jgi:hypothetical protein